ncbi:MAG: chromate transporter [Betaproteobacteria bacterium]|nr:chromate transporter [Betaproteobacteria bacterium]
MREVTALRNTPTSNADLFFSFNWLALQGFGGVLAVVQRELVEKKKWLTLEEFVEDWSVAQILPGPNVINLAIMIGGKYFGWRGALSALVGLLLVPTVLVLFIASAIAGVADSQAMQGALRGMGAVSAGLIMATGIKMLPALKTNPMGFFACSLLAIGTFLAVAIFRLPLAWVLLTLGPIASLWAWRCIRKKESV